MNRSGFLKDEISQATTDAVLETSQLARLSNRSNKPHQRLLHSLTDITINKHLGFYPQYVRPVVTTLVEPTSPTLPVKKLVGSARRERNRLLAKEKAKLKPKKSWVKRLGFK